MRGILQKVTGWQLFTFRHCAQGGTRKVTCARSRSEYRQSIHLEGRFRRIHRTLILTVSHAMPCPPIPRKLPAMAECRRYDICFSISFRLEASLIRFAGQISLTLRRTTDAVCSRTTVSGHRRFNVRGRPVSSAEYHTCGRKAAAEKTLEAEKRPQNNCRASRIIN